MGGDRLRGLCLAALALTCLVAVTGREANLDGGFGEQQRAGGARVLRQEVMAKSVSWIDAPCGRFPYTASLQTLSGDHKCGGVLVDKLWVLTAAHCVDTTSELYPTHAVLLGVCGRGDLQASDGSGVLVELFMSERIVSHPNYTGTPQDGYDIALVLLDRESKNPPVRMATNPDVLMNTRQVATIGFGLLTDGMPADKLKYTNDLTLIPNSRCGDSWEGIIQESMVCAIGLGTGAVDTCPGDDGGPLLLPFQPGGVIENGDPKMDTVVGVTSFGGKRACGEEGGPAVYTRLTSFADWIKSVVQVVVVTEIREAADGEANCTWVCVPKDVANGPAASVGPPQQSPSPLAPPPVESDPETCTCTRDGISAGVETGFGGCSRRREAGAPLCYAPSGEGLCAGVARDSILFPGAFWISCGGQGNQEPPAVQSLPQGSEQDTVKLGKVLIEPIVAEAASLAREALLIGADPEVDFRGEPLLHTAASIEHIGVGTALIEGGADVDSVSDTDGNTPLHRAAMWGNADFVRLLLAVGADPTVKNQEGKTARSTACELATDCSTEEIEALLE